jgi:hypothetical protein
MSNLKRDNTGLAPGSLVDCPTCGLPAEITDQFTLGGAPEPVELVKVVCVRRHWYTVPLDMLAVTAPVPENTSVRDHTATVNPSAERR